MAHAVCSRSSRPLAARARALFRASSLGAIALATFACGGFDVPSWTRPAGPSSDEDSIEPSLDETRSRDDAGGDDRPASTAEDAASPAPSSVEAGADAGPTDAGPG